MVTSCSAIAGAAACTLVAVVSPIPLPSRRHQGLPGSQRKPAVVELSFDQSGVDQQSVESPRLGAAGATVEQAPAPLENLLLLGEGRIERQPRRLEDDQPKV